MFCCRVPRPLDAVSTSQLLSIQLTKERIREGSLPSGMLPTPVPMVPAVHTFVQACCGIVEINYKPIVGAIFDRFHWKQVCEVHWPRNIMLCWVVQGCQSLPVSTLKNILRDCLDTHTKGLWMPPPRHEIRIFDLVDPFSSKLKILCWPLDKNVRSWPLFRPLTPPPPPIINGNVDHNLSNQNEKEF